MIDSTIYGKIICRIAYYILKLIFKGIPVTQDAEQFYKHSMEASLVEANLRKGEKDV